MAILFGQYYRGGRVETCAAPRRAEPGVWVPTPFRAEPRHATPHRAVPRRTKPLCRAAPRRAEPSQAAPRHAMPCLAALRRPSIKRSTSRGRRLGPPLISGGPNRGSSPKSRNISEHILPCMYTCRACVCAVVFMRAHLWVDCRLRIRISSNQKSLFCNHVVFIKNPKENLVQSNLIRP